MQTTRRFGFVPRLLLFVAVFLFFNHVTMGYQLHVARSQFRGQPVGRYIETLAMFDRLATRYPEAALSALAGGLLLLFLLYRGWVVFRNKRFTAKTTGMADELEGRRFPTRSFLAMKYMVNRGGRTFVGLTPSRRVLPPWGLSWRPVYLSQEERSMHRHVLGKTGSGKTTSILWPVVLQDALDGKGVLVIDAKGSDENAKTMRSIAHICGRPRDLRLFSLPAWNRPELFSHAYNLVYVKPRTPVDAGGDVMAMAERVFSVFSLGDNAYYLTQGYLAFSRTCRLLHGMVNADGLGVPFNLRDVAVCLRGLSAPESSGERRSSIALKNPWTARQPRSCAPRPSRSGGTSGHACPDSSAQWTGFNRLSSMATPRKLRSRMPWR